MTIEELMEAYSRGMIGWYPFISTDRILIVMEEWSGQNHFFPSSCCVQVMSAAQVKSMASGDLADEPFDYAFVMGCMERSLDAVGFLKQIKQLLSPQGTLLVACDNRLGLKYFCGEKDPCTGGIFDGIDNYKDIDHGNRCFSKGELGELLFQAGFPTQKFYSVFPSIQYPELILAEDYCGNENIALRYTPLYQSPDTIVAREEELCAALTGNGTIHHFANGYFVECPQSRELLPIKQVTISANRGTNHASVTTLYEDHVEKRSLFPDGTGIREMAQNLEYLKQRGLPVVDGRWEGTTYTMPFLSGPTGDVYLRGLLFQDQELFIREMDHFRDLICASSEIVLGNGGEAVFLKGFCDLVPLNTIYTGGNFVIIDQEYMMDNCPVDYVVFRFVNIVYADDEKLEALLPKTFFFQRYGLVGKQDAFIRCDAEFNNAIKNRATLSSFNDLHVRNDAIMLNNRENLNKTGFYDEYMKTCFEGVVSKKIYVCGSDEIAREFLERYKDMLNIFKVIDDNHGMWGRELCGYEVCPIDAMVGDQEAYKVIICSEKYKSLLRRMLQMQVLHIGIFDPKREYVVPDVLHRKAKGEKYHIGYCAGVYDLFHIGHVNIFKRAKEHCDYLLVGVVSDEAVRANKHCEPFIPFEERIEMVRSCKYVDEAVKIPLDAATVWDAYRQYHFDVQFSGSDYENDPGWLDARQFLRDHGSEMLFFPYTESTSSTKIKALIEKGLLE